MREAALQRLLRLAIVDLRAQYGAIYEVDPATGGLQTLATAHPNAAVVVDLGQPRFRDHVERVIRRRGPVVVEDVTTEDPDAAEGWRALLGFALFDSMGSLRGAMIATSVQPVSWSSRELERGAQLANLANDLLDAQAKLARADRRLERERAARAMRTDLHRTVSDAALAQTPRGLLRVLSQGVTQLFGTDFTLAAMAGTAPLELVVGAAVPDEVRTTWADLDVEGALPLGAVLERGERIHLVDVEALRDWPALAANAAGWGLAGFAAYPIFAGSTSPAAAIGVGASDRETIHDLESSVFDELLLDVGRAMQRVLERQKLSHVAINLQRSLLPPRVPNFPWLDIATLYQPAADGTSVGGDWYDVVAISDDRIALIVGDVAGHDITSAATMGQVRHVLASQLKDHERAAAALTNTDRYFADLRQPMMATSLIIVIHRAGFVEIASAGHPPPILVDAEGASFVAVDPGPPIGTGFGGYRDMTWPVDGSTVIVAFTDGVIERRAGRLDTDLERLRAALAGEEPMVAGVLSAVDRIAAQTDSDDDTAAIVARIVS